MTRNHFAERFYSTQEEERQRQRTRTFVLHEAFRLLHPEATLQLAYSLGDAFYYHVRNAPPLLPRDVEALRETMQGLAQAGQALSAEVATREQALTALEVEQGVLTRAWISDHHVELPQLIRDGAGRLLAFKGPLCETTAGARPFDVHAYPPGLLLRALPQGSREVPRYRERPTLFRAFYEAERWGAVHGVSFVSEVNALVRSGDIAELVRVAEALHARKIAEIADRIVALNPRPSVVLISGPSSSGKTSFSGRLQVELRLLGLQPRTLSLDDFYRPRDKIPRRPDGDYDFEVLEALDVARFDEVLLRLIAGEEVRPPRLDFQTHQHLEGSPLRLGKDGVLIVEGIHGLNPDLTPQLTEPSVFRVYVSALTHLNLDDLNRMSTTDLRLLRRTVRDRRARGYSAEETLARWPAVREGEHQHIFPYQEEADVMFNSALPFELSALRQPAEAALAAVQREDLLPEARRLLRMLDAVEPLSADWLHTHLPPTSLMREFIGGSVLVP
ncbi:MAG: nucleoside kinase [Pseudomonadota bacterium]